jgi:hypothetical protein
MKIKEYAVDLDDEENYNQVLRRMRADRLEAKHDKEVALRVALKLRSFLKRVNELYLYTMLNSDETVVEDFDISAPHDRTMPMELTIRFHNVDP